MAVIGAIFLIEMATIKLKKTKAMGKSAEVDFPSEAIDKEAEDEDVQVYDAKMFIGD